jgi:hypothetical protein
LVRVPRRRAVFSAFELQSSDRDPPQDAPDTHRTEALMKRYGLVLTTLATLLVTGMTLQAAGWFGPHPAHSRSSHNLGRQAVVRNDERAAIPAYYRQGGPRHWRDCLGQN